MNEMSPLYSTDVQTMRQELDQHKQVLGKVLQKKKTITIHAATS